MAAYNKTKAQFNWIATADSIPEKLQRLCVKISGTTLGGCALEVVSEIAQSKESQLVLFHAARASNPTIARAVNAPISAAINGTTDLIAEGFMQIAKAAKNNGDVPAILQKKVMFDYPRSLAL